MNSQPTVLETVALPVELYPYDMGRLMGVEPMHAGATIQCVNHFTKAAKLKMKGKTGKYLIFQVVANPVHSAVEVFTSVFDMVTGVALPLSSPDFLF